MSTGQREDRKLRIVYDTNVIISGLFFHGNEETVLNFGKDGRIDVYVSQYILDELAGVIARKFYHRLSEAEDNLALLLESTIIVEPVQDVSVVQTDPDENHILECCLEANADYLITCDAGDLLPLGSFRNTRIVSAAEFIRIFGELSA